MKVGSLVQATNGEWYRVASEEPKPFHGEMRVLCGRYNEKDMRHEIVYIRPSAIVASAKEGR